MALRSEVGRCSWRQTLRLSLNLSFSRILTSQTGSRRSVMRGWRSKEMLLQVNPSLFFSLNFFCFCKVALTPAASPPSCCCLLLF